MRRKTGAKAAGARAAKKYFLRVEYRAARDLWKNLKSLFRIWHGKRYYFGARRRVAAETEKPTRRKGPENDSHDYQE
jgi:hypothetical protein